MTCGGIAQLGEHLPCTQGVKGSTPFTSTKSYELFRSFFYLCAQCGLQLDYESHRKILCRSKAMTFEQRIIKLNQINIGWINYY